MDCTMIVIGSRWQKFSTLIDFGNPDRLPILDIPGTSGDWYIDNFVNPEYRPSVLLLGDMRR